MADLRPTLYINKSMGISLNLVASAFLVVWMVEYFGYNAGGDIHLLLLAAIIVFLARLFLLVPWRRQAGKPRVL
jgi:hypothetical protein